MERNIPVCSRCCVLQLLLFAIRKIPLYFIFILLSVNFWASTAFLMPIPSTLRTTSTLSHRLKTILTIGQNQKTTRNRFLASLNFITKQMLSTDRSSEANQVEHATKAYRTFDIERCGQHLANGGLVAFPTETVYGLGCDASNPDAIRSVFVAKQRPLSDPLIVHVIAATDAYPLWKATSIESNAIISNSISNQMVGLILRSLCGAFWPGPLTLVAEAASNAFANNTLNSQESVIPLLTADTGYIAIRNPRHTTARKVIEAAGRPIAAPSANKFGHVSPTTADHVWDDLQCENVWILDEEKRVEGSNKQTTHCDIGLESTVVKVEQNENIQNVTIPEFVVTILRQGAISKEDISLCLDECGLIDAIHKIKISVLLKTKQTSTEGESNISPGQTLRHYSPNVPSFLVSEVCIQSTSSMELDDTERSVLAGSIVLDFAGQLIQWRSFALAYRDLSTAGDSQDAARCVFEALRWAERIPGAKRILFPCRLASTSDGLTLAIQDRLTRAASGVMLNRLGDVLDHITL